MTCTKTKAGSTNKTKNDPGKVKFIKEGKKEGRRKNGSVQGKVYFLDAREPD